MLISEAVAHAALVVEDEGSHVFIDMPAKGAILFIEFVAVTQAI